MRPIFVGFALITLITLITPLSSTPSYRRCGNDVNNLWIDIVLVIDNSKIMNIDGVYDTIKSMFGASVRIGTHKKDPRTTRVAIVTYNEEATVVANFDKFQSLDKLKEELDLLNSTAKSESYDAFLDLGLQSASDLIHSSNHKNIRNLYKKLIIVFTSNYAYQDARPDVLALSIRETGVNIATVFTGEISNTQRLLSFVGNYDMNFKMQDSKNITEELQGATTETNCFCQTAWYPYESPKDSGNRFGVCVANLNSKEYHTDAMTKCKQESKEAYMVTEFDKDKRAFNYDLITNGGSTSISSYYNGLTNVNGSWFWDQSKGRPMLPLDPSSGSISSKSGCVADVKFSDGSMSWAPVSCGNRFPFLCEIAACDTDFYCY